MKNMDNPDIGYPMENDLIKQAAYPKHILTNLYKVNNKERILKTVNKKA